MLPICTEILLVLFKTSVRIHWIYFLKWKRWQLLTLCSIACLTAAAIHFLLSLVRLVLTSNQILFSVPCYIEKRMLSFEKKNCGTKFCGWLILKKNCGTNFRGFGQNPQKSVPQKLLPHKLIPH